MVRQADPARLVFIDETGSNKAMCREYGRSVVNDRSMGKRPYNRGRVQTIIGALTIAGLEAVMCGEGWVNKEIFEVFVEVCLVPVLVPGDLVFVDGLSAHKSVRTRQLIEDAGAELHFLPPYSPWLNPIEECWSKVKNLLRSAAARTNEELREAIAKAIEAVTPKNAKAWFKHAGIMESE